jgi:hypothetical protein
MVPNPKTDGRRSPLQVFQTLYIGGQSLPSFAGPLRLAPPFEATPPATTVQNAKTGRW